MGESREFHEYQHRHSGSLAESLSDPGATRLIWEYEISRDLRKFTHAFATNQSRALNVGPRKSS